MQLFDTTQSFQNILQSKKPWQWVLIAICFVSGVSISLFAVYNLLTVTEEEIVTSQDIHSQVCEQSPDFGELTVFISGAIKNSGVYVLPFESRVSDLIEISGGVSQTADIVYVHKHINFAERLSDAQQIYIPTKSETEEQLSQTGQNSQNYQTSTASELGPISINSSTLKSLTSLSGVGEVRAQKIIDNRPYSSLNQLVENEVLSENIYENIKSEIRL